VFHFIDFPEPELMRRIVGVHHPDIERALVDQCLQVFYEIRNMTRLRKRPSTSELIDWIAVLQRAGATSVKLDRELPFIGALLKKEQDLVAYADQLSGGRKFRS
jgi:MoxR-like ATPase